MEKNEPGDRYNRYETVRLRSGLQQDNIVTGTVIAHKLRSWTNYAINFIVNKSAHMNYAKLFKRQLVLDTD